MTVFFRGIVTVSILLLIWEAIVVLFHFPPYILPSPLTVLQVGYFQKYIILKEAVPTLIETIIGLVLGIILGCAGACIMALFRSVSLWFKPILIMSQAIPTFVLAPMFVIWFGYGMSSKIAVTILMLFFPVTSAFYDGLCRTDPGWLDLAKTMNAKKSRIFMHIRIPAALPSLASGIRVATVIAPIGAIVGEWVGASKGLGYLMLTANAQMNISLMFAALFVIVIFSLILYASINFLLKKMVPWQ